MTMIMIKLIMIMMMMVLVVLVVLVVVVVVLVVVVVVMVVVVVLVVVLLVVVLVVVGDLYLRFRIGHILIACGKQSTLHPKVEKNSNNISWLTCTFCPAWNAIKLLQRSMKFYPKG